jgi:hypothetical protein
VLVIAAAARADAGVVSFFAAIGALVAVAARLAGADAFVVVDVDRVGVATILAVVRAFVVAIAESPAAFHAFNDTDDTALIGALDDDVAIDDFVDGTIFFSFDSDGV